jgi:hypothetical protein
MIGFYLLFYVRIYYLLFLRALFDITLLGYALILFYYTFGLI